MKYRQGEPGRIFLARVEHGEDLLDGIQEMVRRENIKAAVVFALGALKSASLVRGPAEPVVPPEPLQHSFDDGRELLGIGTVAWDEAGKTPLLHLHGVTGREGKDCLGCLREQAEVYLTVELVVLELVGIDTARELDPTLGLKVLRL